jgi:hypothetical protein
MMLLGIRRDGTLALRRIKVGEPSALFSWTL